jgi:hypothetical protein
MNVNSFAAPSIKFLKFHDLKMIVYDIPLLAMTSDAVCRTGYYSLYYYNCFITWPPLIYESTSLSFLCTGMYILKPCDILLNPKQL